MNIGDISNSGLPASKHLSNAAIEQINNAEARNKPRTEQFEEKEEPQDSVDISDEARRALAENQKRLEELEAAREALDAMPQLNAERKRELQERIDSAYYSRPEIIEKIASRIARDMGEFKR